MIALLGPPYGLQRNFLEKHIPPHIWEDLNQVYRQKETLDYLIKVPITFILE